MLIKQKSIIILALSCSFAFPPLAGAADTASPDQEVRGGRITRIQAVPPVIAIGNTEYSLTQNTIVYGPDKQPVGIDKLGTGTRILFTIQQPPTSGDRPVITSIRIIVD